MTDGVERSPASSPALEESEAPSFSDAIRFLYERRVRFLARFFLFFGIGVVGFTLWLVLSPRTAEGRVVLAFAEIERGEYPSGKKFSVEDFRGADLLRTAAADAGLPATLNLSQLSANIEITPIIPAEVIARWRKQDRDGARREEFAPNQYQIQVRLDRDNTAKTLRFFDALVKRYRDRAKLEQKAALRFVDDLSAASYGNLVKSYDYWEIPHILEQNVDILQKYLAQIIKDSKDYKDARSQYSFRALATDLFIWKDVRLEALKAMTYKGRLVRSKESMLLTAQYRLEDLDIATRQSAEETSEAMRLLELAQKPQMLAATQGAGRDAIPIVDSAVLDRLTKSDYISPLVQKISSLQENAKEFEAKKWRLEKDLLNLQQARNVTPEELPASYRGLVDTLSGELRGILQRYNALLDKYLNDSISSLVMIREGPRVTRGTSPATVLFAIGAFSVLFALLAVVAEQLVRKALSVRGWRSGR